jgi:YD repeat-containing protein
VIDAGGKITRYVYDRYGWLQDVVDPSGGVTTYGYDLMGVLTSLTDALGRVTRFVYSQGRLVQTIYPKDGSPSDPTRTMRPGGWLRRRTARVSRPPSSTMR